MGLVDRLFKPMIDKKMDEAIQSGEFIERAKQLGVLAPTNPTPRSMFFDPISLISQTNYKEKYGPVSYDVLYQMAQKTEIVSAILNTRLAQIGSFSQPARWKNKTGLGFQIRFKDAKKEPNRSERERLNNIEEWVFHCGYTDIYRSGERRPNFSEFLRRFLRDSLIYDQSCIEIVPNREGKPCEWWSVDAATIRIAQPNIQSYSISDGRDLVKYVQVYQSIIRHMYTYKEMAFCVRNGDNNIKRNGYGNCYDDQTEILTRDRGFVKFAELLTSDYVATRNMETKEFQWQKPISYTNERYVGEMIKFASKSMDLVVTPNHRMLTTTYDGRKKVNTKEVLRRREKIVLAKDLLDKKRKIPITSKWIGTPINDITLTHDVDVGKRGVRSRVMTLSGDDYCALMGAYLSEGNLKADKKGIEINQMPYSKGFASYEKLCKRINRKEVSGHNGKAFIISSRAIYQHCIKFGHCYDKYVPQIIKDACPEQLKIFWDYFVLGDGTLDKRKNMSGRGSEREYSNRITTTSRRLADDLVEIAQKIGISASVSTRLSGERRVKNADGSFRMAMCQEAYTVIARYSDAMLVENQSVDYDGTIHCVTVPNGIVYVRRNGKSCWSGNSELETLINLITSILWAEDYNKRWFSQGQMINGILNLKNANLPQEQLEAFRRQWQTLASSVTNAHKLPVLSIKDGVEFINFHSSNRDMEYSNWMEFLVKMCTAVYLIDPAEVNYDYRGASESAPLFEASPEAKLKHSRDKGLRNLLNFIEEKMNFHIVQEIDSDLYFEFVGIDMKDEQEIVNIRASEVQAYKKVNEVRKEAGLELLKPEEGGEMIANAVIVNALLQEKANAQQAQAEQGGGPQGDPADTATHAEGFEPESPYKTAPGKQMPQPQRPPRPAPQ